jgi:hypothetical protein
VTTSIPTRVAAAAAAEALRGGEVASIDGREIPSDAEVGIEEAEDAAKAAAALGSYFCRLKTREDSGAPVGVAGGDSVGCAECTRSAEAADPNT